MTLLPYDPDQVPSGRRRELLDRVPAGGTVLDVGCWSGFVGRYLRETRQATVDGIEPNPDMASLAAQQYRNVAASSVEAAFAEPSPEPAGYDAILFLDVLEHLVDPADVLRTAKDRLAPDGRVLISMPNAAHWTMRKELLLGRWDYRDSGLMDRTHLRFFTQKTVRALVTDAGLEIVRESYSVDQPPLVRLSEKRLELLERWPGLFAVQLLIEARR